MVNRWIIAFMIFCCVSVLFILSSGAPLRVNAAVICSWAAVAVLSLVAITWPGLSRATRLLSLVVVLVLGAWLLPFVVTRVVGKYELNARVFFAYFLLEVFVIGLFLGLTELISRWLAGKAASSAS